MTKKLFLVLLIAILLSGSLFAADRQHKHESGNMLLGINLGTSFSPNIFKLAKDDLPTANYGVVFDFGLTFDFYLFSWLSLNTGAHFYSGAYLFWDAALNAIVTGGDVFKYAKLPICVTIPIMAHINVPFVEWLYLGGGINLNIPVSSWTFIDTTYGYEAKGKFYIGVPLDFGFDFIKAGRGGSRLFFRFTPEFHSGETVLLTGFIWQIYNFKLK